MVVIIIFCFFIGLIGTSIGGLIAFFYNNPSDRLISSTLSFAAGIMLSVVCFDLLPEAFRIKNLATGLLGMGIGILTTTLFDVDSASLSNNKSNEYIKMGTLMWLAIALHNFPEGLAIGTGFAASKGLGISMAIVISLHDIPEGIAIAAPLSIGGVSKLKSFLYTVLSGIPTGIAALVGLYIGTISPYIVSLSLGFAGGAMIYVTCAQMMPKSRDMYKGRISIFGMIIGMIGGIIISEIFK